jgi:signal peptidase I
LSNQLLLLIALTLFTGAVLVINRVEWQGRDNPLSGRQRSMLEFSYGTFPVALLFLVLQWFLGLSLALVLTLLTAYTAFVLAINKLVWSKQQTPMRGERATLVEYSRSFFPVLLFVLIIRSFVFEPFRIPSGSMMPTLLQGDFIFVSKYSYGLRLPVTETKIFETGSPERGDVVVFRLPSDPTINYIKRVVGLPGDEVVYARHRLMVNGEEVPLEQHPEATRENPRFVEQLGDREHEILITRAGNQRGDGVFVVPEGHYFMMGDNRDNSTDSRFIETIPETHLVGEARRIWLHMDGVALPLWDRIGDKIQ